MARPKEFDRDNALEGAVQVFARRGYDGATTEELLTGMNISRQSMYDTFGDKRRLYLQALRRYCSGSTAEIIGTMYSRASPLEGLEAALMEFAARPARSPEEGCLGVGATMQFGRSDPDVVAVIDQSGETLIAAFERLVRAGQRAGEMAPDLEPNAAAQFLSSVLIGLKVSARAGVTSAALRGIVRTALRSLK